MKLKSYTLVKYKCKSDVEISDLEVFESGEKVVSISLDDKYIYKITYKEDRQVFEREDRSDGIKEVET